ncbi:MAG: S-layer homology domain-containing protein [Butyricicoccus sp.]|nr:S-layer homology domain-containing protein [Butyricicoccus sp.]
MKNDILRRLCALLLCIVLALGLAVPSMADDGGGDTGTGTGTGGDDPGPPPAGTTISLDKSSIKFEQRRPVTLIVTPSGLDVEWSSSNDKVAVVDGGTVTAVGPGTATVTAAVKLADGTNATATCEVTVEPAYVDRFSLSFDEYEFKSGEREHAVWVSLYPDYADYKEIEFKSGEETVVTVGEPSEGTDRRTNKKIIAVGPGETYVSAALEGIDGQKSLSTARGQVTVPGIVISYAREDDGTEERLSDSIAQDRERNALEMTVGVSRNVSVQRFGDAANTAKIDWYSGNNTVVAVTSTGRLTPRAPGKTTITATCGNYTASFSVDVEENRTGLVEIDDSIPAGTPMSFGDIRSDIRKRFSSDTEKLYDKSKTLSYVTSMNVSPTQGVLYNGYISEADTGAGVSMSDRFYDSGGIPGSYTLSSVTFVPNSTFSGNAEISYTGVATDGTTLSGIIRIPVDAMEDVSYTTGSGQNVFFRGSDFGTICRLRTGRELSSVTFTLPSSSRGTLYYGYTADNQYSEKVSAATSYRRNGNPNLDSVSFLPVDGFSGSVRISYRGTDTASGTFSGYVTVTVTDRGGDADVVYSAKAGKEVSFTTRSFNTACRDATGENLEYVRFTLPDSSEGTLYYTSGSTERKVTEKTLCYRSDSPYISDVYFVPAKNAPDQVRIAYTGHSVDNTDYSGTVLIDYSGTAKSEAISYSVYSGRAVQFDPSDFNTASIEATGSTLNYVYFELPAASRGLLCYNYTASSSLRSVSATTRYYRSTSSSNRLDRVWFLADPSFTGTAEIPYTGHSNDGEDFTGTVSIRVNSLTPAEVRFSGGSAQPIAMSASQIRAACNAVMDKELSYIEFTSLPSSTQGRIYRGYTGYDSGTQVVTGTPYYVSASPGIDQLSFVPRGGFSGTAVATYTGVSTSGERVSGQISFVVASAGSSAYFSDMGGYSWAVSAADYLYQNGIINGVGSGRYAPGDNIRRCDFVVMLCRAYNFGGSSGMSFADVPSGSYYASAVATASALGIVNGDGNNFRPNDQLTRQDAMVIIKRALEAAGWSLGGNSGTELYSFGDANSVSAYAQDAVATLVRLGAVNGDSNGDLRPWAPINRAEAAVMLHYVMTM